MHPEVRNEEKRLYDIFKAVTYRSINASLTVHDVYKSDEYINEKEGNDFRRLWLSSYNLTVYLTCVQWKH